MAALLMGETGSVTAGDDDEDDTRRDEDDENDRWE
eukprot:CAMPEP_0170974126 /NCGR_PEP_ID=MMETSP0735-20130129/47151_1 /TAXON_ID=186038 /ORGANISM="Fragilariopsis kerguelensis, Strain L26-C5" /LENGTH=34 /DNA_ID= /DNA_START= /DNA_END= /DNA_ORIENTATION=